MSAAPVCWKLPQRWSYTHQWMIFVVHLFILSACDLSYGMSAAFVPASNRAPVRLLSLNPGTLAKVESIALFANLETEPERLSHVPEVTGKQLHSAVMAQWQLRSPDPGSLPQGWAPASAALNWKQNSSYLSRKWREAPWDLWYKDFRNTSRRVYPFIG